MNCMFLKFQVISTDLNVKPSDMIYQLRTNIRMRLNCSVTGYCKHILTNSYYNVDANK